MISMRLSEAAAGVEGELSGLDTLFTGCSIDSRSIRNGELFIALHGKHFDGHSFIQSARDAGASAALVEQNDTTDDLPYVIVKNSRAAMAKLASQWRGVFSIPVIAVTGSNGKTTVKEMITSILNISAPVLSTTGNLNNEIGVPLTLFGLDNKHRYAVIEMGANHTGEIAFLSNIARPTVALITQCAPAHLKGFGSIEGVAQAKAEIYSGLTKAGIAVVNADDHYANIYKDSAKYNPQISFGIKKQADVSADNIIFDHEYSKTSFMLHASTGSISISLSLLGHHNVMNSLAAAASCIAINIPLETIQTGLEKVSSIKGRMYLKSSKNGIRIFDDTYNANPGSLSAGLEVLSRYPGRKWLVLGDMGELGTSEKELHQRAGETIRNYGIERLYTLGELARFSSESFGSGAIHFDHIDQLVSSLKDDLPAETTLLVKGSRAMEMDRIVSNLTEGSD